MLTGNDLNRFNSKFKIDQQTECWNWIASLTVDGYGQFSLNSRSGLRAHRISYQHFYGIDPGDNFVCHKCDNNKCVNPEHLFLGTNLDNVMDMLNKGRSYNIKLTEILVREIITDIYNNVYFNVDEICNKYELTRASIYEILNGNSWTHITDQLVVPLNIIKNKIVKQTRGSILNENDVIQIKQLLKTKQYTQLQISKQFNISESTIADINRGKSWKHIVV